VPTLATLGGFGANSQVGPNKLSDLLSGTASRAVSQQGYPLSAMTDDLDDRWRPLRVRESGDHAAYDSLHPGVPPWLNSSLGAWVWGHIRRWDDMTRVVRVFRLEDLDQSSDQSLRLTLELRMIGDEEFFLDVVDYLLSRLKPHPFAEEAPSSLDGDTDAAGDLAQMLSEAGSLWKVDWVGEHRYGLVRRMRPEVEAAAEQVMSWDDKAAWHLRLAWSAVYGRQPDPGKGYGEAIKAMEAATIPMVCPDNPRATLGRVINDLRAKPGKWVVNLKHPTPDRQVQTVADMLDLVWKGQSDRHGSPDPSAPISVTQEQAEAAVHLAVTVVQWFNTGVVTTR